MANLSREGGCCIAGCDKPIHAKRMCRAHYAEDYRKRNPEKRERYNAARRKRALSNAEIRTLRVAERKVCIECGGEFSRPLSPRISHRQWEQRRCCSVPCANAIKARGRPSQVGDLNTSAGKTAYLVEWQRRKAMPHWATWWEERRRTEDVAELAKPNVIHARAAQRVRVPRVRLFIGHVCQACGSAWLSYAAMPDTDLCSPCNKRRWQGNHRQRAKRYGIAYAHINPHEIFNRDGWRCQLCGCKTRRNYPHPRTATLDHIIPLATGGQHTPDNLQCACLSCNSRKGARAANDQLRLAV